MLYKISLYFIIFIIYSFIGYVHEVIGMSIINKKFNLGRGYLIGPYLPVYGLGATIITILLNKYSSDLFALFVLGVFYCCTLEYLTSYLLEKIYGLRWWDYSDKKFNLNGRINLVTGIKFGISSILIIKFINPILFKILTKISPNILILVSICIMSLMFADTVLSTYLIFKLNIDTKKYFKQDATKEIKEKINESLSKYRFLHNRLLHAFPNLSAESTNLKTIKKLLKNNRGDKNDQE